MICIAIRARIEAAQPDAAKNHASAVQYPTKPGIITIHPGKPTHITTATTATPSSTNMMAGCIFKTRLAMTDTSIIPAVTNAAGCMSVPTSNDFP